MLPNLSRLAATGGVRPLSTTHSPESPTAWASFATGVNPGKHNIYDFLVRDTATYLPDLGMVRREPARFLFDYIPVAKPKLFSIRGGTSFWVTAGQAGVRSSILTVPVTFPPEDVPNGELLSGLPLPDIRGTMGTFYYFATDLSRYEEGSTEFGGILKRLLMEQDVARTELVGPPNPLVRAKVQAIRGKGPTLSDEDRATVAALQAQEDVRVPMTVRWNRAAKTATVEIAGESLLLEPGKMSKWIDLDFRVNFLVRLHGMAQLLLLKADNELQLYVSPVNWKPDAPPLPISSPPSFAADLFQRLGYYRTLGWAEATWPLNEGRMDERTFMEDLYKAFDDRAAGDPQPHRRPQLGSARRRRRVDRPRAAHDVAAAWIRSTRCTTRPSPRNTATRSSRSIAAPTSSSAKRSSASSRGRRCSWCRTTASTRGGRRSTSIPGSCSRDTWSCRGRHRARRSSTISLAAVNSGRTSTGRGHAPTRWASARSTSICAAAKHAASSARAPRRSNWPTSSPPAS